MSDVPYFLETRVRQALARTQHLARSKGLADAFDADLYAAERAVHDLLGPVKTETEARTTGAGDPAGAQAAKGVLAKLDALLLRLQGACDRGPRSVGPAPSRGGRMATARR